MYLLFVGLLLIGLKFAGVAPVAAWDWWWVLSPLAGAVLWWSWADRSGYTKRKAAARDDARRDQRRARAKQALDSQAWQHNRRDR